MTDQEWQEIAAQLQAPFDPADVEFRPQGKLNDRKQGRALAYVDARVVAARLDAVVGPQNWTFNWEAVIVDNAVRVVKGTLTIHGVSKSDIGDADKTEPSKASVSDSLKRAAVLWGPGRYLYSLEAEWVQGTAGQGDNWYIPDSEIARLRKKLPQPKTRAVNMDAMSHEELEAYAVEQYRKARETNPTLPPLTEDVVSAQARPASQKESRGQSNGAQSPKPAEAATARSTGNQSTDDNPLRQAWTDFRYVGPMYGLTTEPAQVRHMREAYPGRRMQDLTAADVWAQSTAIRAALGMAPHAASGAADLEAVAS